MVTHQKPAYFRRAVGIVIKFKHLMNKTDSQFFGIFLAVLDIEIGMRKFFGAVFGQNQRSSNHPLFLCVFNDKKKFASLGRGTIPEKRLITALYFSTKKSFMGRKIEKKKGTRQFKNSLNVTPFCFAK